MKSVEFCYWLQGFFEINNASENPIELNKEQIRIIRDHLNMVFYHEIDPSYPKDQQAKLNHLHAASTTDVTNRPRC